MDVKDISLIMIHQIKTNSLSILFTVQVVGVMGVDVKEDGSADLGPIAVCCQGKGVIFHYHHCPYHLSSSSSFDVSLWARHSEWILDGGFDQKSEARGP